MVIFRVKWPPCEWQVDTTACPWVLSHIQSGFPPQLNSLIQIWSLLDVMPDSKQQSRSQWVMFLSVQHFSHLAPFDCRNFSCYLFVYGFRFWLMKMMPTFFSVPKLLLALVFQLGETTIIEKRERQFRSLKQGWYIQGSSDILETQAGMCL